MKEYIKKNVAEIIKIKSESNGPMNEIVEFVKEKLSDIGLEPTVFEGDDHSPVVIATHGEGGVCFSGHLDTVPLGEGWTKEQGEIIDGKIYGRGALDMKGPCISMLTAAWKMKEEDIPFTLIFTTDEEVSMAGAKAVASRKEVREAPAVVVCEPTNFLVVNQEKGVYQFEIKTKGENAHASMPQIGENAISKMLPILIDLDKKGELDSGPEILTCCVDVVKGGKATNVIPDSCRAEVDVRFPSTYNFDSLKDYLFGDVSGEFELKTIQYLPSVKVEDDNPMIKKMLELADTETWSVPYGTEMVMFVKENPNTFIFGPGGVETAHQPDEHIKLSSLIEVVDIYVKYAEEMA